MSAIPSGSTQHISEQDAEVQQEESASSNRQAAAEAEANVGQTEDDVEDRTESASVAEIDNVLPAGPGVADESTLPQPNPQEDTAASGGSTQNSQEGSVSTGGSSMESQESSVSSGSSSTESQEGATGGTVRGHVLRVSDINSGKESLQEKEKEILRAVAVLGAVCVDPNKQDSQDSTGNSFKAAIPRMICLGGPDQTFETVAVGDSSTSDSLESDTTTGSSTGNSFKTAAVGDSSTADSLESGATTKFSTGNSFKTVAVGDCSSANSLESGATTKFSAGNSFKTAVDGDSSSANSQESGVAGGISNSTDSPENPSNGTESVEEVAVPVRPPPGSVVGASDAVDGREHVCAGLLRGCLVVFNTCACICDYVRPCSRRIRKSKICTFLKFPLTVIPLSAFFMGMHFSALCPVKANLPILMMLMGIFGVFSLIICLGFDLHCTLCSDFDKYCFKAVTRFLSLILLGLFIADLGITYSMVPSFDPADHAKYCAMSFYYFAYYMNFVVIGIVLLCFFIYVPTQNETFEEEYERLH